MERSKRIFIKKTLAVLLVFCMVFSMTAVVYADDAEPAGSMEIWEESPDNTEDFGMPEEAADEDWTTEENIASEGNLTDTEEEPEAAEEIAEEAVPDDAAGEAEGSSSEAAGGEQDSDDAEEQGFLNEDTAEETMSTEDEEGIQLPEEETDEEDLFTEDEPEKQADDEKLLPDEEETELFILEEAKAGVAKGTEVTGTFDSVEGMDIATIRYCWTRPASEGNGSEKVYGFAEFTKNAAGKYEYTFTAPCDNFVVASAAETTHGGENVSNATVIAAYFDLNTWDGAVDVSWYDPELSEYHIETPAQFAGLAAIVNGSIDSEIKNYNVKGARSYSEYEEMDAPSEIGSEEKIAVSGQVRGLPDCIECEYVKNSDLGGPVFGPCYMGLEKNDFLNKTVYLDADLYMNGGDGAVLDTENFYQAATNLHDGTHEGYAYYPNWTPIGGLFLSDLDDQGSAIKGAFNGVLEGGGHYIFDLYCYRWSYPKPGTTAYGYADSTGVVGRLGYLYTEEEGKQEILAPAIRNLGLTGFVMGRRSVGGILGRAGSGEYYKGSIYLENLVNHATVYATDSKGVAGICGTFWNKDIMEGQVLKNRRGGSIINCYNTGIIRQCEYAGPAGGIVGENDSADIYCCYNTGEISSRNSNGESYKMGRGIGANDKGTHYTVADCYYLEDRYDCDVLKYCGYYYENADSSLSITTVKMKMEAMTDGTLLRALNVNGIAYYEGADGLPILAWEAGAGTGTLLYTGMEGGVVSGSLGEGEYPIGTVVYLSNVTEEDWTFRYYTLNEGKLSGAYVSVSPQTVISGFCQKAGNGYLELPNNPICDVTVYRITEDADGVIKTELKNGDLIREGDDLAIEASVKEGLVPDDPDLEYREAAGVEQPFLYTITYSGKDPQETYVKSITVSSDINGEDVLMRIEVEALTVEKLWKNLCNTDWYEEGGTEYTITSAEELAGVDKLVEDGTTDFYGVTITLGNDISLANTDGSAGTRYWDGIGNSAKSFAGTFDGAGYRITDIRGSQYGLFAGVKGKSANDRAVIRNVSVYGLMQGYDASGIAGVINWTEITGCSNYCVIDGEDALGSTYSGGIAGSEKDSCIISNCVNYAPVYGVYRTGGIVGESSGSGNDAGTMEDCFNFGRVEVLQEKSTTTYAGGLAGAYKGSIARCANYGEVDSAANYSGGLVGYMLSTGTVTSAKLTDCYNAGAVQTACTQEIGGAGGLCGYAKRLLISHCFSYGSVSAAEGSTAPAGSFAGRYVTDDNTRTVKVYLLDSSCDIVLSGTFKDPETGTNVFKGLTYEEVARLDKIDVAGIRIADEEAFAAEDGVLAEINANEVFALANALYPELCTVSQTHTHTGGTATCSEQAVCEECGLHYGPLDPDNHIGTEICNAAAPEWMSDGYTGDVCCPGCHEILEEGEIMPVDTSVKAIAVSVTAGEDILLEKDYTVAQFDALKQTDVVGYQYGKTNGVTETCLASNRYVTLEALLADCGYSMDELVSAEVVTSGSFEKCTRELLLTRNLYVNEDGKITTVPAAIGIYYNRQVGFAEQVIQEAKYGALVFMTGLEQKNIDDDSVGGFRLISPVESVTFEIEEGRPSISDAEISGIRDMTYSGEKLIPEPVVTLITDGEEKVLEAETDYIVNCRNNIIVGEAQIEIIGTGEYTGTVTGTFNILPKEIEPEVTFSEEHFIYNGRKFKPAVTVQYDGKELSADEYDVTYPENAVNAGTYDVTVTMKGNYTGTVVKPLVIEPKELEPEILLNKSTFVYNGKEQKPKVTVTAGDMTFSADGYTLTWPKKSVDAGTYSVTAKLTGNYTGSAKAEYGIAKAEQTVTPGKSTYQLSVGKTQTISVTAKGTTTFQSSNTAVATVDKSSGKVKAVKVGTVTITITAAATTNYKKNTAKVTVKVTPAATTSLKAEPQAKGFKLTWKKVAGATGYYLYRNGTKFKTISGGSTLTWKDTAATGNGTKYVYKVVAYAGTGTSSLSKSVTKWFVKQPTVSSAASTAKQKAVIKWASNTKASGYQIRYSLKKDFSSGNKTLSASKSATGRTITGLTSGKTYYVQIRTYITKDGTKYWSAYSTAKAVKIK